MANPLADHVWSDSSRKRTWFAHPDWRSLKSPRAALPQGAAILDSEGHEGVAEDVAEHTPLVGLRTLSSNKAGRGGPSDAALGNHRGGEGASPRVVCGSLRESFYMTLYNHVMYMYMST